MNLDSINESLRENLALAFDIGLTVPDIKRTSKQEELEELAGSIEWDLDLELGLAMKVVDGTCFTLSALFFDGKFDNKTIILNDKALMTGKQGFLLGSNVVTIFADRGNIGRKIYSTLKSVFLKNHIEESCYINIDIAYKDDTFYYKGIRIGLYDDFAIALAELGDVPVIDIDAPIEYKHNFSCSLKLYTMPWGIDNNKSKIEGLPMSIDAYEVADGYIVTGTGNKYTKAWQHLYSKLPDNLSKYNVCYRLDGASTTKEMFDAMRKEQLI